MPEEWIVRVEGREYGPVELEVLREWKEEGRVLPTNQARRSDAADWTKASEIPGLFQVVTVPPKIPAASRARRRSFGKILREALRIYGKGFPQFFCLTLLVIIPSVCGQLIDSVLQAS